MEAFFGGGVEKQFDFLEFMKKTLLLTLEVIFVLKTIF